MRRICGLIFGGLLVTLVSCGPQSPQRPIRRTGSASVDSAQIERMEFNRQLAAAADEQLMQLAQGQEESYALYECNTWATILEQGEANGPTPQLDEEWTVHMRTYAIDGRLLVDTEGTYRIGKQELPLAVDANIGEWHRGCRVRMYAPWYAAYGITGTDVIPPYENVIIELELK